MEILILLIIFAATLVGSICGMGGGVIIKPLLDSLNMYQVFQISMISGCSVLAMSIASLGKHLISKTKFNYKIILCLSIGSILGGLLGDVFLSLASDGLKNVLFDNYAHGLKIIQNSILGFMVLIVIFYMVFLFPKDKKLHIQNSIVLLILGFVLGALSNFLEIGGGPINVCIFCFVCGMNVKEAGINSLFTILFAQITKFVKWGVTGKFVYEDIFNNNLTWWILALIIVFAVAGGLLGAVFNKKMDKKYVNILYCCALAFVFCLSVYNIISNAIALN